VGSIPIVQIHFIVGQASCLSKLKGGQDAHRNYLLSIKNQEANWRSWQENVFYDTFFFSDLRV
jgi:hypothetical protein